jgi:hypothetical protein
MAKPLDFVGYFAGPNGKIVTKPVSTTSLKCLYRGSTNATFRTLAPVSARWQHLRMLGPVIRASVGDTIKVYYGNNCSFQNSLRPHGVFYAKANDCHVDFHNEMGMNELYRVTP